MINNNLEFKINSITVNDWMQLRAVAGFPSLEVASAAMALKGSDVISLHFGFQCIGLVRIIGDGGYSFYLNDLIIAPLFQRKGYGKAILDAAIDFIESNYTHGSLFSVSLFSTGAAVGFYEKLQFKSASEVPMKIYIKNKKRGTRAHVSTSKNIK